MKLTYDKRLILENAFRNGTKTGEICRMLGVTKTTIYKELKRTGMTRETYDARRAQLERGMR